MVLVKNQKLKRLKMSLPNEPNDVTGMYEIDFNTSAGSNAQVRITDGKFKNFLYKYGTIKVGEFDDDAEDVPLKYDYELLEAPEDYDIIDEEHESTEQAEFEQLIGDILYDIIVNSNTVKEATDGNRNDDSK